MQQVLVFAAQLNSWVKNNMALGYQINPRGRLPTQRNAIDDMLARAARPNNIQDALGDALGGDPLDPLSIALSTSPSLAESVPRAYMGNEGLPEDIPATEDMEMALQGPESASNETLESGDSNGFLNMDNFLDGLGGTLADFVNLKQPDLMGEPGPDNPYVRSVMESIRFGERGRNEFWGRTKYAPKKGSSAFGDGQITRDLLAKTIKNNPKLFNPAQREFADHMVAQQTQGLKYGYNDNYDKSMQAYQNEWVAEFGNSKESLEEFKALQYGGHMGVIREGREVEDKALYNQIFEKLLTQEITSFAKAMPSKTRSMINKIADKHANLSFDNVMAALVWHEGLTDARAKDGWKWLTTDGGKSYLARMGMEA